MDVLGDGDPKWTEPSQAMAGLAPGTQTPQSCGPDGLTGWRTGGGSPKTASASATPLRARDWGLRALAWLWGAPRLGSDSARWVHRLQWREEVLAVDNGGNDAAVWYGFCI